LPEVSVRPRLTYDTQSGGRCQRAPSNKSALNGPLPWPLPPSRRAECRTACGGTRSGRRTDPVARGCRARSDYPGDLEAPPRRRCNPRVERHRPPLMVGRAPPSRPSLRQSPNAPTCPRGTRCAPALTILVPPEDAIFAPLSRLATQSATLPEGRPLGSPVRPGRCAQCELARRVTGKKEGEAAKNIPPPPPCCFPLPWVGAFGPFAAPFGQA